MPDASLLTISHEADQLRTVEERTMDLDEQNTLDRIRRYTSNPPEQSRVFTITAAIAETVLRDFNRNNRPAKPSKIKQFASDMAAGNWPLTGDTIKFSTDGRLLDGQNRLKACVKCAIAFRTHVAFGIEDEAFVRLDQGRNRTGSDALVIAGYQNTAALSSAVRWAHLIETGRAKQRDSYTPAETLRITAILYLFNKANPTKATEFAAAWEAGKWDGRFKPISLMNTEIGRLRSTAHGRVHDVVRAALVIKAWNLFVSGRRGRGTKMSWATSESFPEITA